MFQWINEDGQFYLAIIHGDNEIIRKFPKDQIREVNEQYVMLYNGFAFNNEGQKVVIPFLSNIVRTRILEKKNVLMLITGEASSGKSYTGLSLCEAFDPNFNVDNVIFTPKEFFDVVLKLQKNSWVLLDEPAQALSHREWYSDINKAITWTVESFRFRLIHMVFTAINPALIDKVLRDYLVHFLLVMQTRGRARVYQYSPSPFNPETRTPYVGDVIVPLPTKHLIEAYEAKRESVQLSRYYGYSVDLETQQKHKLSFSEKFKLLTENKDALVNSEGKFSVPKIMLQVSCSRSDAYEFKKLLEEK